jgi:hypothetical protein
MRMYDMSSVVIYSISVFQQSDICDSYSSMCPRCVVTNLIWNILLYACCRYIVQYAAECGGVIVSTDNYRDLLKENPAWRETIENRSGTYTNCSTL